MDIEKMIRDLSYCSVVLEFPDQRSPRDMQTMLVLIRGCLLMLEQENAEFKRAKIQGMREGIDFVSAGLAEGGV